MKKTPTECRAQLIDAIMNEIVPGLKFRKYGYAYPIFFIKLTSEDIKKMVTVMDCETDRFGKLINDIRKEFYMNRSERDLVERLWNVFWWPAVEGIWPLQCYEVRTGKDYESHLYLLARTSDDEWVGVETKVCYAEPG